MNKYKINNNNKTNTKHEFNVKYERYNQDISKDTLQMQKKKKKKKSEKTPHFCKNMSPCHAFTSPSCSPREKSSLPIFCKCGEPCYK
jgi:hypothetical protein